MTPTEGERRAALDNVLARRTALSLARLTVTDMERRQRADILLMRSAGMSLGMIAEATGLSRPRIWRITPTDKENQR